MQRDGPFRSIWIWIVFAGFVLFVLSANTRVTPEWNPAEQVVVQIVAPFQKLFRTTIGHVESFWMDYFLLVDVRRENEELKKEIAHSRWEIIRYRELLATHERLRELLRFKETIDRPVVAAQVIGLDPTGWFQSVIIDKGKRDGIQWDMAVVNAEGIVGRVVAVSMDYAKVLLIVDQNSAVDCLIQSSRDRGMVRGLSHNRCTLDYMSKSSEVAAGDRVVTSGLGGVFPKGLPVGTVASVKEGAENLFKEIEVIPTVDFSRLEEVLVILNGGDKADEFRNRAGGTD